MKKLKLWYYRNFKVISNEKAKELGLLFWENVYGDSINHYGCRSIWFDYKHRAYRVEGLVETQLQKAFPKQDVEKQNKTAVEWLIKELESRNYGFIGYEKIIQQGKEMEKKQILDTYIKSYNKAKGCDHYVGVVEFAEHYYDKTFKSK